MYSVVIVAVKLKRVRWIRLTEFQDCGDKDIVNDVAKFAAEAGAFGPVACKHIEWNDFERFTCAMPI